MRPPRGECTPETLMYRTKRLPPSARDMGPKLRRVEGARAGGGGGKNGQRWGEEPPRPLSKGPPNAPAPPPGMPGQWPSSTAVPGRRGPGNPFHAGPGKEAKEER